MEIHDAYRISRDNNDRLVNGSALGHCAGRNAGQGGELAKKLQNPVASLISEPLQSNFDFRIAPSEEGWRYTLNIQPLVPISIGSDWNLIVRTIVPYVHQEDVFEGTAITFEEDIDGILIEVTRFPAGGIPKVSAPT